MKLQTLAAACAAVISLSATSAMAGEVVTAKLSQPVAQPTKFIAGGAVFKCEGDACVASAPTSQTYGVDTCKAVAARVGPVATFAGRRSFDQDRLAQCNVAAAKTDSTTLAKQ